ncbi:response regulator [Microvirga sp. 2MCAF38]|uniref:response regulator n=1 Tax=Microvirga sp. 2MCAF38 TaxID=3232989 RepID=UPI003F971E16
MNPHVLIVDDDLRIRQMLSRYLLEEGFHVSAAENGQALRDALSKDPVDIVLLDLVLPGEDGLALAHEIRQSNPSIGIIMLTGRNDMVDRVIGLEMGADDYVAKPFHLREVLARIRSLVRRVTPASNETSTQSGIVEFEGWSLDFGRRRLTAPDGKEVVLTSGEFNLLTALATNAQHVLHRDRLMGITKGRGLSAFERTIDAQVVRLRKKIEPDPKHPAFIKSVRGVGYVFAAEVKGRDKFSDS